MIELRYEMTYKESENLFVGRGRLAGPRAIAYEIYSRAVAARADVTPAGPASSSR